MDIENFVEDIDKRDYIETSSFGGKGKKDYLCPSHIPTYQHET
ncbi:hypothetical protein HMPREF0649_01645 [Segatella buccae D17]|nr:hypothetical protein HMPREF0649_01645 [Segatella buccae D17]